MGKDERRHVLIICKDSSDQHAIENLEAFVGKHEDRKALVWAVLNKLGNMYWFLEDRCAYQMSSSIARSVTTSVEMLLTAVDTVLANKKTE